MVLSRSNFDSHGYTTHQRFLIKPPDSESISAYTPFRSLTPKGLDGIVVTGLGISAHRDAMPILRMQPCIQNQGFAMGTAASMAAASGKSIRNIDIKKLQKILVAKGNLPESVLTDTDSFPLPKEQIAEAVQEIPKQFRWILDSPQTNLDGEKMPPPELEPIGVALTQPETMQPLLIEAFESAESEDDKLIYAHILGMMGNPVGSDILLKETQSREWDDGWRFRGMGQFGPSISPVDSLIIALSRTKDKRALKPILEKTKTLSPKDALSHHRAVAIALETLGDPSAAQPLAELLQKPGMSGYAYTSIDKARKMTPAGAPTDNLSREYSLRELILARALYRCGDYEGLGEKILKQYEQDLRGHYARHAHAVLMGQ